MLNYEIKTEPNKIIVLFKPILCKDKIEYVLNGNSIKEEPSKVWITATHTMKDFIGNITKINNVLCSVRGAYYGRMQIVNNIKIEDSKIKNKNDRVMVTEHINVDGKFELIATKSRILYSDVNFINVGWFIGNKLARYMRIDIYNGEYKIIEAK